MFLSETCVRLWVWLVEEDRMDFETKVHHYKDIISITEAILLQK